MNNQQTIIENIVKGIRKERNDSIPQCSYVIGRSGYGKTYLLNQLSDKLKECDVFNIINTDCLLKPIFDTENFLQYINEKTGEKRNVVLLDNLDDWLDKWTRTELFRLRSLLYEPHAPIVVGTGRTLPTQFSKYNEPFYDTFSLYTIGEMDKDCALQLINGMRVQHSLPQLGNEMIPKVHALLSATTYTPSMCRLLSIVPSYECPINVILRTALMPLTAYYRAMIVRMTPSQRLTWIALLSKGSPMLFSDLREITGQSGGELSPQLLMFIKNGLLVSDKVSPKKTLYSISDPIMTAWYKYCTNDFCENEPTVL